jgi:hypothetical protein
MEINLDTEIKVRLRGAGIKPDLISAKELAGILESVDDFLVAETLKNDNSLKREDIIIGLCKIEDKSIGLTFKTTLASIVIPVLINSAASIKDSNFNALSNQSFKALQTISNFSKKHNCEAEFSLSTGKELIKITPETVIPEPVFFKGISEIIGEVIRVGGKKPKAALELIDGSTIYCDVQESIAKDLGRCLYSLVKCSGLATWNTKDYELEHFKIMEFEKFSNIPANETMKQLSNEIGHYFSGITDVASFVANLRNGDI